jgi:hypothetical protein
MKPNNAPETAEEREEIDALMAEEYLETCIPDED